MKFKMVRFDVNLVIRLAPETVQQDSVGHLRADGLAQCGARYFRGTIPAGRDDAFTIVGFENCPLPWKHR
ncbi:hypothetical protein RRF57_004543 [Xylaria bambusicola]|uniref:Uncharacterized protein n=1 Tax=Xylaria bambusicola TaxID=326684 RepID=A0AAN7UGN0_9PEZI